MYALRRRARRILPILAVGVLAWAPAFAADPDLELAWSDCLGDGGGRNLAFACNTNSGRETMVASFVSPQSLPAIGSLDASLVLHSESGTLPPWWQVAATGCRAGALNANFTFGSTGSSCLDTWAGGAIGGATFTTGVPGSGDLRVLVQLAVPAGSEPLQALVEYFAFNLTLRNTASAGPSACAGCGRSVCLVFTSCTLHGVAGGDYHVFPTSVHNWVTWQGTAGSPCPAPVPVRNRTWGGIKALYR